MTLKNGSNYEEFVFPTEIEQEKQDQLQTEHNLVQTNLYRYPIPEPENNEETVQPEPESNYSERKPSGRTRSDRPERRGEKTASEIHLKYAPPTPFPRRLLQNRIDQEFQKFIDMVKKLKVTIHLVDAIAQIPKYAKFLKDIICNKGLLEEQFGPVKLTEQCSAVLQREMPPKLDDPGRFTVPCAIGNVRINHALCDLGANVSLMPRSIYDKIGVDELRPTRMTLQLADSSTRLPLGVLEDMPIQLGKFFIPGDFVVMDMEEDDEVPIILGRPFLTTAGALIDARDGTILFRIGDEQICFSINEAMKRPSGIDECYMVEDVGACCMVESIKSMEEKTQEQWLEMMYENSLESFQESLECLQEEIGMEEVNSLAAELNLNTLACDPNTDARNPNACSVNFRNSIQPEPEPSNIELKPLPDPPTLKEAFNSTPIFQQSNWDRIFELMCDISDYTIKAVLGQQENKKTTTINHSRKGLEQSRDAYTTTENFKPSHLSRLHWDRGKGTELFSNDLFPDQQLRTVQFPGSYTGRTDVHADSTAATQPEQTETWYARLARFLVSEVLTTDPT